MNHKTKVCIKCGRELELNPSNFFKRKDAKDGFRNDCKDCQKEARTNYYEENKASVSLVNKKYQEKNKEKIKIQRKQYHETNKELLKQRRNKDRDKENQKIYWQKHRDRLIVQASNWKKKNADRVKAYKIDNRNQERELARKRYRTEEGRKKSQMRTNSYRAKRKSLVSDLTFGEWDECLNHFNNQCAYCGFVSESIEQEHFIPVTKDGGYTKSNILPACRSCNANKLNRDFYEWYPEQPFYSKIREQKILDYLGVKREVEV